MPLGLLNVERRAGPFANVAFPGNPAKTDVVEAVGQFKRNQNHGCIAIPVVLFLALPFHLKRIYARLASPKLGGGDGGEGGGLGGAGKGTGRETDRITHPSDTMSEVWLDDENTMYYEGVGGSLSASSLNSHPRRHCPIPHRRP